MRGLSVLRTFQQTRESYLFVQKLRAVAEWIFPAPQAWSNTFAIATR